MHLLYHLYSLDIFNCFEDKMCILLQWGVGACVSGPIFVRRKGSSFDHLLTLVLLALVECAIFF